MQDIFRKSFKQAGYRVLVTADPARAAGRFRQDAAVADCVIFNAQQIGPLGLGDVQPIGRGPADRVGPGHPAVGREPAAVDARPAPLGTASC